MPIRILIDAREFVHARFTGIARVIQGLTESLAESDFCGKVLLAVHESGAMPFSLTRKGNVTVKELPKTFLKSEKTLSDLSRHCDLYISPYPKLPLFGVHCLAAHVIHDVLDLTHPLYRRRVKTLFDRYRLRKALQRADITWYDSAWSMAETQKYFSWCGRNPKVRHPGIHEVFRPEPEKEDDRILEAYGLKSGYVLALGNGMPHKNLGILLEIAPRLERPVVFAGALELNRRYWESRHPRSRARWIPHVEEEHLPALLRGAFCLVQPSLVEGYGYPPLEAMACGRPAVVSRISVLLENTGACATSASPDDPAEWKEALKTLEDASCFDDLVKKGLKWTEALRGRRAWEPYLDDINHLMKGA